MWQECLITYASSRFNEILPRSASCVSRWADGRRNRQGHPLGLRSWPTSVQEIRAKIRAPPSFGQNKSVAISSTFDQKFIEFFYSKEPTRTQMKRPINDSVHWQPTKPSNWQPTDNLTQAEAALDPHSNSSHLSVPTINNFCWNRTFVDDRPLIEIFWKFLNRRSPQRCGRMFRVEGTDCATLSVGRWQCGRVAEIMSRWWQAKVKMTNIGTSWQQSRDVLCVKGVDAAWTTRLTVVLNERGSSDHPQTDSNIAETLISCRLTMNGSLTVW